LASVAVTVIGNVPICVGVPPSTPAADSVKPVGKVLAVVNVYEGVPPPAVKVWLNGTFC